MKLTRTLFLLPIALMINTSYADTNFAPKETTFTFSTEVTRSIDKDLMQVQLNSQKTGKKLSELKQQVSANLNKVLELVKQQKGIQIQSNGVNSYANYDPKGKVSAWVVEGSIQLESQDIEVLAKILDNLGDDIGISYVDFSVSQQKLASLEDEMTLDAIKQFQHKAEIIQKGLNAKGYHIKDVQLNSPGDFSSQQNYAAVSLMAKSEKENVPLVAGKASISANATGSIIIEQ